MNRSIQAHAFTQHHKQRHVALAPQVFEINHHRVQNFGQGFYRAVELAGAHAQAVAVDGGITAAINNAAAVAPNLEPVTVAPDAWINVEVTGQVALLVHIAPQIPVSYKHLTLPT